MKKNIENIENLADQSFLYTHISHYIKKTDKKQEFLKLGFQKAEELKSAYDKMNRYDMSVSEAVENAPTLGKSFTIKTWDWILKDKNGNYQNAQKIIDLIQEYDEELAKELGISEEELLSWQGQANVSNVVSLDEFVELTRLEDTWE